MNLDNAHTMYNAMCDKYTPDSQKMGMSECVKMLAHTLMQRGALMQMRRAHHPKATPDLANVFDYGTGQKLQTDAKGTVTNTTRLGADPWLLPQQRARDHQTKKRKGEW